jgi:hypothetical protein
MQEMKQKSKKKAVWLPSGCHHVDLDLYKQYREQFKSTSLQVRGHEDLSYCSQDKFKSTKVCRTRLSAAARHQGHPCTRQLRDKAAGPIIKFTMFLGL